MDEKIKVSVIIPIKNAEKNIKTCIDSLLKQTLDEFEIILVDMGSCDGTSDIVKGYMQEDKRIALLRQEGINAGAARNIGLKQAKGEYVIFLDADDFFHKNLLKSTYNRACDKDADIVLLDGNTYDDKTKETKEVSHYLRRNMLPKKPVFNRADFYDRDILSLTTLMIWSKLYRKSFVENKGLEFQSMGSANEVYFSLLSLCVADKVTVVCERLVNHRINKNTALSREDICCFADAYESVYLKAMELEIYGSVDNGFVNAFLSSSVFTFNAHRDNRIRKEIAGRLKKTMLGYTDALQKNIEFYKNSDDYYLVKSIIKGIEWDERRKFAKDKKITVSQNADKNRSYKVSVIISIYNSEKYLKECLDSVVNQTLRDIEIVCVNDGSTDKSGEIIREYASRDDRITVIDKENGGPSAARNTGMEHASGEYIYFLDSDDYLEQNAMQLLYEKCIKDNLDIVFFDANCFSENNQKMAIGEIPDYIRKNDYSEIVTGIEYIIETDKNGEYRPHPCLQMLKGEYMRANDICFYDGILHEDNLFTFSALIKAKRVCHIKEALYNRRVHAGSIMTRLSFEHCYGYFVSYYEMKKLLDNALIGETMDACELFDVVYRIISSARSVYATIPREEQYYFIYLGAEEYYRFYSDVFMIEDIRAKFKQTNAKLNQTYAEKAERGIEIKELKEKLAKGNSNSSKKNKYSKKLRMIVTAQNDIIRQQEAEIMELNLRLNNAEGKSRLKKLFGNDK